MNSGVRFSENAVAPSRASLLAKIGEGNRTTHEAGAVLGVLGSAAPLVGCLVLRSYSQLGAHDCATTEPELSA